MPVDHSIYFQQKGLDLGGNIASGVETGLRLSDMAQQRQQRDQQIKDATAERQAYMAGNVQNEDGTTTFDPQKTMSALASAGYGQKAMDLQDKITAQAGAKNQLAISDHALHAQKTDDLARSLSAATPENYDSVRKDLISSGLASEASLPPAYDKGFVDRALAKTISYKESLDQQHKKDELAVAKQKADAETAGVDVKREDLKLQREKLYGAGGQLPMPPPGAPVDPALLVPKNVPQHHQAKVFGEIEAAQNTMQNRTKILEAFDNAANKLHGVDFIPGMANADQKALHALMGPTFKDVEGTVRQAAMDNMNNNTTPQFGDSAETLKKKRDALVGYLESKSSAPTAKGYGIDLSKFPSTSAAGGEQGSGKEPPHEIVKKYNSMSDEDLTAEYQKLQAKKAQANANAR